MSQIKEYQVFKDEGKAEWENGKLKSGPSKEYQKIKIPLVFDVKHDGHLTKEPSGYSLFWSCITQQLKVGFFRC